jgi:hypothetical protein
MTLSCSSLYLSALSSLCLCVSVVHPLRAQPSVGLAGRIESRFLPGGELEVKPHDDRKSPLVVRVVSAEPISTGYRYEIEYVGLAPGTYDLKDYLRRKDRSSTADLPALPVTIRSVLPPGQVTPNALEPERTPRLGGYRALLLLGGGVWVLGLMAILLVGRRRRAQAVEAAKPRTLADHLRPLVEDAVAGKASPGRLAGLERALITYWGRKLKLADERPIDALAELRRHREAGPLLVQLESWLHRPASSATIDVGALLEPYRHLPPDALEVESKA